MEHEIQQQIMEFERQRQLLMSLGQQKQQMQMAASTANKALEELDKSKENSVYVAIGNILIQKEKKEVQKELKDQKETAELRLKTVEKQEENTLEKLNTLKSKIESAAEKAQAVATGKQGGDKTLVASSKKQ
jgi:prefoldin beta subunit